MPATFRKSNTMYCKGNHEFSITELASSFDLADLISQGKIEQEINVPWHIVFDDCIIEIIIFEGGIFRSKVILEGHESFKYAENSAKLVKQYHGFSVRGLGKAKQFGDWPEYYTPEMYSRDLLASQLELVREKFNLPPGRITKKTLSKF